MHSKSPETSRNRDSGNRAHILQRVSNCEAASAKINTFFGASIQLSRFTCGEGSFHLRIDDWELMLSLRPCVKRSYRNCAA
jgi:hypothetical protein